MLGEARARGDRVIFVSDTPHSETFVAELLTSHGLAKSHDRVFTSADRRVSKSAGGLFQAISQELGTGQAVTHSGDNRRSDLASARVEGWAQPAPSGSLPEQVRTASGATSR